MKLGMGSSEYLFLQIYFETLNFKDKNNNATTPLKTRSFISTQK